MTKDYLERQFKNYYEYVKDNAPRYNVLDYGLKGDGITDNTTALRSMLSEVPVGATIYFPSGTYNISDTITLSKAFNFVGEGLANGGTAISKIVYSGNTANTTMFIPDANTFPMVSFEKLHFIGNSFTVTTNDAPFTSLPYPFLKETTTLEGISCLDFGPEMASDFRVKDCSFNGFSGFAIKGSQHKFFFTNCDFQNCNVAIKTVFDSLIQNCHFRMCGVAVEIIRDKAHVVGSVNISDCWADLLSRHFMESTECSTVLNVAVSNVWVDMVDGSAFYFTGNMQSCDIQGTFGRIGMSYAGLADADRTALIAPYSDFCYANSIRGCEFNITNGSNTMGSGENPDAECISKYLFANTQYGISDVIFIIPTVVADKIYDRVNNVAYRLQASCRDGNVIFNVGLMFIDGVASYNGNPSSNWQNVAPSAGYFCFDTINKRMYRSSGTTQNDWEAVTDIPHYPTMPSIEDLFALPNNTVFETDGYYLATDKCGGQYLISTSVTKGSLMINNDDKTRYLTAIDVEGTTIDVCRYGVRSSNLLTDLTPENTYATSNSDIIENLYWPYLNCIFKFPSGRFYFARPLKTIGNGIELSIFGDRNSAVTDYSRINNNTFDKGTILAFPFLTNGQTAITLGSGTIKDVTILGDFTTYDITFDRTKIISAPDEVISETIKKVDETQIKCTGLYRGGIIENVTVAGFYTGINMPSGNIFLTNINIFHCHTGVILHFDNKVANLFGWNIYDFIELHNNCISVTTARVDSCVHMVVTKDYCGTFTLTDIDGDWCTDSMIYLTKDGQYGAVTDSIFDGIHGRCCTLKSYDSTQSDGVDVRDLVDTNGYGVVRVDDGITCKNNQFTFNNIGNNVSDVTNYLTPAIAITFGNIAPSENIFKTADTIADLLKVFQTSDNFQARVDLPHGTYYINGTTVKDTNMVEFTSQELSAMW